MFFTCQFYNGYPHHSAPRICNHEHSVQRQLEWRWNVALLGCVIMTCGYNEKQSNEKRDKERMKIENEEAERGGRCDEN